MIKNNETRMPKVGEHLMRVMTGSSFNNLNNRPEPCVVVYVNKPHHYYTVRFDDSGIFESYNVPLVNDVLVVKRFQIDFERRFGRKPVGIYVYESGALYDTVNECAKDLGVIPANITSHLCGKTSTVNGYHLYILK